MRKVKWLITSLVNYHYCYFLHFITPDHWVSSFMAIYMSQMASIGLFMAPYIILPCYRAVHGALHNITMVLVIFNIYNINRFNATSPNKNGKKLDYFTR